MKLPNSRAIPFCGATPIPSPQSLRVLPDQANTLAHALRSQPRKSPLTFESSNREELLRASQSSRNSSYQFLSVMLLGRKRPRTGNRLSRVRYETASDPARNRFPLNQGRTVGRGPPTPHRSRRGHAHRSRVSLACEVDTGVSVRLGTGCTASDSGSP